MQLCSDFPDGVTLQLLHLKRSRNAGVLRVHHCLDTLVLHFCSDLLIHRSASYWLVSGFDKTIPADDWGLLLALVGAAGAGHGIFAIHDLMSPARYGDMDAFVKRLKAEGYEEVRLIDTTDGAFMEKKEASWLGLAGSTLLIGKK